MFGARRLEGDRGRRGTLGEFYQQFLFGEKSNAGGGAL